MGGVVTALKAAAEFVWDLAANHGLKLLVTVVSVIVSGVTAWANSSTVERHVKNESPGVQQALICDKADEVTADARENLADWELRRKDEVKRKMKQDGSWNQLGFKR